jgi:hypothetical protein
VRNADGRLEVFYRGTDGHIWHVWQKDPNGLTGWLGPIGIGGDVTSDPAVGANDDGRLEVYNRGGDGGLWHFWQGFSGAPWSVSISLGGSVSP